MLVQKKTISTQLADAIRQKILAGDYPARMQLRQEALAAEFGVSRVPVREALHQLHSEGFVDLVSHKGAVVASVSLEEIFELYELRARVETWLLALAIPRMTEADFRLAQTEADRFGQEVQNSALTFELNWNFHKALYTPSEHKASIDMVERLHRQIEHYTRMMTSLTGIPLRSDKEHHEIVALCRARDPLRASQALEVHILTGGRYLVDRLKELRDR